MVKNNFEKRKKDVLNKLDKSSKKSWDKKIVKLCDKVNSFENFYTTSSCSGRVVLIIDDDKKRDGLFIKVWHNEIKFDDLITSLRSVIGGFAPDIRQGASHEKSVKSIKNPKANKSGRVGFKESELIKFKQEPVIIHVACKNLEDALDFLKKARGVGFKRGGIISGGKNGFVLELIGTEKLEFPIIEKGKVLVSEEFLKIIVKKSNDNLKRGWERIGKFENLL